MPRQAVPRNPTKKGPSPKMAFGSSVDTLIEVYSNCISLLKAFRGRSEGAATRGDVHERKQVQLRKSLKSDRARVQRAYSSAVSEVGTRFERGDDRARSALSRVLKKLKAAITNILRSASKQKQQALDYEALMLLSNVSRTETLRTFDQLSRRLGSTSSRQTVATTSTGPRRRSGHSSSGSDSSTPRRTGKPHSNRGSREARKEKKAPAPQRHAAGKSKAARPETVPASHRDAPAPARHSPIQPSVPNRMSLASIATDSTKLGEMPERKWTSRRARVPLDGSEYYTVAPVFPLKSYEAPVKERRFLGLFRRRS